VWPQRVPASLGALALYLGLSLFFFGGPIVRAPGQVVLGSGDDPSLFVWMLAWWPHAIGHGLDPIVTHALFAPDGFNLMWTTSIPGPGLLVAPITLVAGPVVAYNVLALLAPALSAFTAFLLCRYLTGRFWPSVAGGYVFGFSDYMLGALVGGHLHLSLVPLLPLCVLLVVRHVDGSLGSRPFVALLAACLVGEFLISMELLLLLTLFGGFALAVAAAFSERRGQIVRTSRLVALAYLAMTVVVSPLLYYTLAKSGTTPRAYPGVYASDLANFVIPTGLTHVGRGHFQSIAQTFRGNLSEQGAYLGIPLLAAIGLFATQRSKRVGDWALILVFALAATMSLGTRLHVSGASAQVPMPWDLMTHLPLARYALPARTLAFMYLAAAVIIALWLARGPSLGRWLLVGLGIALILPNRGLPRFHDAYAAPRFITAGVYKSRLSPRDRVLILPFIRGGRAMRWQAQSHLDFALVEGYGNRLPASFTRWPIVASMQDNRLRPDSEPQLRRFLRAKGVTVILVDRRRPDPWTALLARMRLVPVQVAGVSLYRIHQPRPSEAA
jgi:hypothetical protein